MKKIICFGDSNTFGYIPNSHGKRYNENERWSAILKTLLNDIATVVEAGCNDRTCFAYNPKGDEFNGSKVIKNYVDKDTDILLLALGINDMQISFRPDKKDIENGIINLIKLAKEQNGNLDIILVIPSCITEDVLHGEFDFQFDEISIETSKLIPAVYKKVSSDFGCKYVDLNEFAVVSDKDGLHYELSEHNKIAGKIYEFINKSYLL